MIFAGVEVDGWDPSCVRISPGATTTSGPEPGDEPYYAYAC